MPGRQSGETDGDEHRGRDGSHASADVRASSRDRRSGGGCQPGYEQSYIAAGFSCQYAGYNHYIFSPTGPIWTPVYLLFGIWYCADGQFRFRC